MSGLKSAKMILGVFLLGIIGSALSQNFQGSLTAEGKAKLFPTAGDQIPEYEIMPIHKSRVQKRSINGGIHLQLQAFGQHIKLWLNPLEGILASYATPVWLIKRGFNLTKEPNLMKLVVQKLYQDHQNAATMHIDQLKNGDLLLNGIIGSQNLHVKSIPLDYFNFPRRNGRSVNEIPESEIGNHTYHIIYKSSGESGLSDEIKNPLKNSLRFKRSAIDTIYPEIMAIIDYPLYQKMHHNLYFAIGYTLAFFNGVDLKYRALQNPKYRLNIAGIIIATEPNALEYMDYHANHSPFDLNVDQALKASERWLGILGQRILPHVFDAAITLTSDVLCLQKDSAECKRGTIGYAHVGLSCQTWYQGQTPIKRNSGIVHDDFDFEGIRTTAHELAHLFGVDHDGERTNINCRSEEGHIMTPAVRFTRNGSEWSYCSLKQFERFLQQEPVCLFDKPKVLGNVPRFLPGILMDAHQQCRKYLGTQAVAINDGICNQLVCTTRNAGLEGMFEAAEGTPCGVGKICLHSHCVHLSQINF